MSHPPSQTQIPAAKSIVHEVDLKKKKLQAEIQHLQKQLRKQQKLQHLQTQTKITRKDMHSPMGSKSPRSQISAHTISKREVKPAISDNWKKLFKLDPIVFDPQPKKKTTEKSEEEQYWVEPSPKEETGLVAKFMMQRFDKYRGELSPYLVSD